LFLRRRVRWEPLRVPGLLGLLRHLLLGRRELGALEPLALRPVAGLFLRRRVR
jgi:hypothetical protein